MPRDGALCVTRTSDGGKTWQTMREGLPQRDAYDLVYRHGLDVDDSGERLAMGSTTGALWASDNGGERWDLVNAHLPPIMPFGSCSGAAARRAYSSTISPSSAVSNASSARRASMSLLICVSTRRFGRIWARWRSSKLSAMWLGIGLSRV